MKGGHRRSKDSLVMVACACASAPGQSFSPPYINQVDFRYLISSNQIFIECTWYDSTNSLCLIIKTVVAKESLQMSRVHLLIMPVLSRPRNPVKGTIIWYLINSKYWKTNYCDVEFILSWRKNLRKWSMASPCANRSPPTSHGLWE